MRRSTHLDQDANNLLSHLPEYGRDKLRTFAVLLLNDEKTVSQLHELSSSDNELFLQNVFKNWLRRDDKDKNDRALPRTWKALGYCLHQLSDKLHTLARDLRKQHLA